MREREPLGRRVVIKQVRKGKFGHGPSRNQQTGKRGTLEYADPDGTPMTIVLVGDNFKDLERKLRATGRIPTYVTLKKSGETTF